MSRRPGRRSGLQALLRLALLGAATLACAAPAAAAPPPARRPRPVATDSLQAERERTASEQAEAARKAAAAGRLHEALWRWRVVEAVARDPIPARTQAAALLAQATAEASSQAHRGDAARRTRDMSAATADYQAALQSDPQQPDALAGLRDLETTEALRLVAQEQSAARHGVAAKHRTAARRSKK